MRPLVLPSPTIIKAMVMDMAISVSNSVIEYKLAPRILEAGKEGLISLAWSGLDISFLVCTYRKDEKLEVYKVERPYVVWTMVER